MKSLREPIADAPAHASRRSRWAVWVACALLASQGQLAQASPFAAMLALPQIAATDKPKSTTSGDHKKTAAAKKKNSSATAKKDAAGKSSKASAPVEDTPGIVTLRRDEAPAEAVAAPGADSNIGLRPDEPGNEATAAPPAINPAASPSVATIPAAPRPNAAPSGTPATMDNVSTSAPPPIPSSPDGATVIREAATRWINAFATLIADRQASLAEAKVAPRIGSQPPAFALRPDNGGDPSSPAAPSDPTAATPPDPTAVASAPTAADAQPAMIGILALPGAGSDDASTAAPAADRQLIGPVKPLSASTTLAKLTPESQMAGDRAQAQREALQQATDDANKNPAKVPSASDPLPVFVDQPASVSLTGHELRQELVFVRNGDAIASLLKADPARVKADGERQLSANGLSMPVKLLYAWVLTALDDPIGRAFLLRTLSDVRGPHLLDTMWTLRSLAASGATWRNGHGIDMTWAENALLAALNDTTTIPAPNEAETLFLQSTSGAPRVQVRQLAFSMGNFAEILGEMRSERLVPLLVSWARSNPPPVDLRPFLHPMGKYEDSPPAKEFILERLQAHGVDYAAAVTAASDMGLREAVPMLMAQLDDPRSYWGLAKLGTRANAPALRSALKDLKPEDQPRVELLIIRLQEPDPVLAMIGYATDRTCPARVEALTWLDEISDERVVPALKYMLLEDRNDLARETALRGLARIRSRDAVGGMIMALGRVSPRDGSSQITENIADIRFREAIHSALHEITQQDFGFDRYQWQAWFDSPQNVSVTSSGAG